MPFVSETITKKEEESNPAPAALNELLKPFNLFGWRPRSDASLDENYMEMVMLVTRNSICLQGYMACIIVNPRKIEQFSSVQELERSLYGAIVGIANNMPLFSELDSDIHAEIGALGKACRLGSATEGCTAYITMPPCKRCFAALLSSGIKRIVSRRPFAETILPVAEKNGIEIVALVESPEQTAKMHSLTKSGSHEGERSAERQAEIEEQRKRRREATAKRKEAKKKRQKEDPAFQKKTNS